MPMKVNEEISWTEKWFLFVHNLKYLKKRFTPEMEKISNKKSPSESWLFVIIAKNVWKENEEDIMKNEGHPHPEISSKHLIEVVQRLMAEKQEIHYLHQVPKDLEAITCTQDTKWA